jgi:hypothetical protein
MRGKCRLPQIDSACWYLRSSTRTSPKRTVKHLVEGRFICAMAALVTMQRTGMIDKIRRNNRADTA